MSEPASAGDTPGPDTGAAKKPAQAGAQPEPQRETDGVRCLWMRGGTSKGGYFLAEDLPADTAARDAFLLRVMGSPDPLQIDGMGGGDPLRSKVAVSGARPARAWTWIICSCRSWSTRPSSPTRRTAAIS